MAWRELRACRGSALFLCPDITSVSRQPIRVSSLLASPSTIAIDSTLYGEAISRAGAPDRLRCQPRRDGHDHDDGDRVSSERLPGNVELGAGTRHRGGHGRAAWNAVTGANPAAAGNFGRLHPDHARRYEIAAEFVMVVKRLWDGWADDAIVADRATGQYIDPRRVRRIDHQGPHFSVAGPLNIGRAPQGHPVVLQAGGSELGLVLAATTADVVFSLEQDLDEARAHYAAFKARLPVLNRDPASVKILPGVMPVVGRTDREAFDTLAQLQGYVDSGNALALLSDRLGVDMSVYPLDGPVPDLALPDTYHSFSRVMLSKARRESMTLRDLYNLTAAARGHWVLCGSAQRVADTLGEWFTTGAADGFNIMPPDFDEGFETFTTLVVPLLQERGWFRQAYPGATLRETLGLERPSRETEPTALCP